MANDRSRLVFAVPWLGHHIKEVNDHRMELLVDARKESTHRRGEERNLQ